MYNNVCPALSDELKINETFINGGVLFVKK